MGWDPPLPLPRPLLRQRRLRLRPPTPFYPLGEVSSLSSASSDGNKNCDQASPLPFLLGDGEELALVPTLARAALGLDRIATKAWSYGLRERLSLIKYIISDERRSFSRQVMRGVLQL